MSLAQRGDLEGRADTQVLLGDRVLVLALTAGWAQVVVPDQPTPLDARGYPAWIPTAQLSAVSPPPAATVATVLATTAGLRPLAGSAGSTLEVTFGTRLPVLGMAGNDVSVGLPAGRVMTVPRSQVALTSAGAPALPPTGASIVATARGFLGLAYLWAGTSGYGYDCSGLAYSVFRVHGITLPRDADAQAGAGRPVPRTALLPGDLVFFATAGYVHHVAIYAGGGLIIDAPGTGGAVEVTQLSSEPYASEYYGARRMLP